MINKIAFYQKTYRNTAPDEPSGPTETGWRLPGVGINGLNFGLSWTNPNNITTLTTSTYALAQYLNTEETKNLIARSFDFSDIPDEATINGVRVRINQLATASNSTDSSLYLLNDSSIPIGANKATNTLLSSSFTLRNYGGESDLWTATLNTTIIKSSNFGISYRVNNDNDIDDDIQVASVEMNINYTV